MASKPFEVDASRANDVTTVLCDAFHDYPVMRHIVGTETDYDDRLRVLVDYFVRARFLDGSPVLALEVNGVMTAATTLTAPGERKAPPELSDIRDAVWANLGEPARARYAGLCDIWGRFWPAEPHYHVNMIGVLPAHQGQGFSRTLLDFVHALSDKDPDSRGTSLTTELASNVKLYEHFGYRITGHEPVHAALETWGMFRGRNA